MDNNEWYLTGLKAGRSSYFLIEKIEDGKRGEIVVCSWKETRMKLIGHDGRAIPREEITTAHCERIARNIDEVDIARVDRRPSIIRANECANTDVRKVNVSCSAMEVESDCCCGYRSSTHLVDPSMMFAVFIYIAIFD